MLLMLIPILVSAELPIIEINNSDELPKELPDNFILKLKDKFFEVIISNDPERGEIILIDQLTEEINEFFNKEEVCYFLNAF